MPSDRSELDQLFVACHRSRLAKHRELMLMVNRPRIGALGILGGSVRIRRNDRFTTGLTWEKSPQSDQGREGRQVASMGTGLSLRPEVSEMFRLRERLCCERVGVGQLHPA